jgi:hypothetical protein
MPTPFDTINDIFFSKIEEDSNFFDYYNLTAEQSEQLASDRADMYLKEAAARLVLETNGDINFCDYDTTMRTFNFDASNTEKELLASLQFEAYLERSYSKLNALDRSYAPSDLQVFSPANDRRTFINMYNDVKEENIAKIDKYNAKDRKDNSEKLIDYTSYDDSD